MDTDTAMPAKPFDSKARTEEYLKEAMEKEEGPFNLEFLKCCEMNVKKNKSRGI